ncbi:MAG: NIPSNAP family protein [Verrucomicrobiae bacterium]|nr:NIPSNAP family protein [Verrucomicrobiae bacterium]
MREEHFKLYEKYGWAPQTRILGKPYSYVKSIEDPNEFILMWSYEDLADREAKREQMWKDPEWQVYVTHSKALGAVVSQYNKLVETV